MPDNQYKEVLIVVIVCISLFLILAAIILAFLFIYQRRRLQQAKELVDLRQQLSEQSLKAQLEIQEQTFLAISQEIHDNVGQVLSLAKVQINIIGEKGGGEMERGGMGLGDTGLGDTGRGETDRMDKDLLAAVRDNIGKAMTDLRDLARSLSSDRIQSRSLHETLAQEIERVNKTGVIRVEATIEGDIREIEGRKKLILFRIIQESIQNCVKHAEATSIFILFHYRDEGIHVCIRDNGKGFDTEAVLQAGNGLGLGNIRTRVQLTGGSSSIESVLQEGTRITLNIPYE